MKLSIHRFMSSLMVVLLGLAAYSPSTRAIEHPSELYESLCQNKPANLDRVSQAKVLIEFVKSKESSSIDCDAQIKQAILDLEEPLREDNPDNHCTPDRANRIIAYVVTHIRAKDATDQVPEPKAPTYLPQALKKFFIAYGLFVSKICKEGMLKLLMADSKENVDPDDYKEILRWTEGADVYTKTFLTRATNYDDMFLVGNAICDSTIQDCRKLYVQTEHWDQLREMRITCHRVFEPFYENLIMPFVRLASFGIDYLDHDLNDKLNDFRANPMLQKWYKIVYLCESFLNIVPLPIPEELKTPEFHIDEQALKELDQAELEAEVEEEKQLEATKEEEAEAEAEAEVEAEADKAEAEAEEGKEGEASVEEEVVELDESCSPANNHDGYISEDDRKEIAVKKLNALEEKLEGDEELVVECRDGKKVLKKKKKNKNKKIKIKANGGTKIKKNGNFLTKFGKDIVKEMRKLQQERKAYLLSKKTMPITNILLKKDVEKYQKKYGPIKVDDFGKEPPIDYKPKPMIPVNDELIPLSDKRVRKTIRRYEVRKRNWRKIFASYTKRYVRILRRVLFMGRVKFGGEAKPGIATDRLLFKVFDKAMWEKDNQELVNSAYGKFRKLFEFNNISNVATCVSLVATLVIFYMQSFGPLAAG